MPASNNHNDINRLLSLADIECDIDCKQGEESFESVLADATRTSYIEGHWVSKEEDILLEYSIIDACLPSSGDYSTYTDWGKLYLVPYHMC